jgi:hypothetical protein
VTGWPRLRPTETDLTDRWRSNIYQSLGPDWPRLTETDETDRRRTKIYQSFGPDCLGVSKFPREYAPEAA